MTMIPLEIANLLHEVPEDMVIEASEMTHAPGWKKLIKAAQIFRHANCTPIFLANEDGSRWAVSSKETFKQRLH